MSGASLSQGVEEGLWMEQVTQVDWVLKQLLGLDEL